MGKSEMMKQFEEKTGKHSVILKFMAGGQSLDQKSYPKIGPYDYNIDYIAWLEAKATAYDRLMSGRATPKELANILQAYVACNDNGRWSYFWTRPHAGKTEWYVGDYQGVLRGIALLDLPPCSCHWTDSLIVPDGWEEK